MTASGHIPTGGDDATPGRGLVRSEERLHVGTEVVPAGSLRLEKYLVTETRTITVPVVVERVRLIWTGPDGVPTVVENPPPTAPSDGAGPTPDRSSRWLVRHEEQIDVSTRMVAVERIRLDTYVVAGEQAVTADLRSERVELVTRPATDGSQRPERTGESTA